MSEIKNFSDYTSKYNSNVDYSALFGGTSDSSSVGNTNMLSDYAAIKNGSYGKLMKAGCRKIIGERRYFTEAYTDENKCGFPEKISRCTKRCVTLGKKENKKEG